MRLVFVPTVVGCAVAVSLAAVAGETLSVQPSAILTAEVARTCDNLAAIEVAFVGAAGTPFVHRLSFENEIEKARQKWLPVKAEYDRSQEDIELARKAADAWEGTEHNGFDFAVP